MAYGKEFIELVLETQYFDQDHVCDVIDITSDIKKFRDAENVMNYLELNNNKLFATRRPLSDTNFGSEYSGKMKKYMANLDNKFENLKQAISKLKDGKKNNGLAIVFDNIVISKSQLYVDYRKALLESGCQIDVYELPLDSSYYNKKAKEQKNYDRCSLVVLSSLHKQSKCQYVNLWCDYGYAYQQARFSPVWAGEDENGEPYYKVIEKEVTCLKCEDYHDSPYSIGYTFKLSEYIESFNNTNINYSLLPSEIEFYQNTKHYKYKLEDICEIKQGVYPNKFKKYDIDITDDKSDDKSNEKSDLPLGLMDDGLGGIPLEWNRERFIFPVRLKDVQDPFLSDDVIAKKIDPNSRKDFLNWKFNKGDVAMTLSGSNLRVSIIGEVIEKWDYEEVYDQRTEKDELIWKETDRYYIATSNVLRIRPNVLIMPEYIYLFLNSDYFKKYLSLENLIRPVKSFNIETLKKAPLPCESATKACTNQNDTLKKLRDVLEEYKEAQKKCNACRAKISRLNSLGELGLGALCDKPLWQDDIDAEPFDHNDHYWK